jgi:glucose/arabinose dehydrogenase
MRRPTKPVRGLVAVVALAAGCSDDGATAPAGPSSASIITTTSVGASTAPPAPSTPTSPTSPTETNGSTTDAAVTTSAPTRPTTTTPTTMPPVVGDPVVASEEVGEFDQPIDLAVRAGDDALWFVEQGGRIVRFDGDATTTALDLTDRVSNANEQGLLGLTFDPEGGLAYVNFTDEAGVTNIAEYAVTADATFDPASERIVLQVPQPYSNHNAGDLAFGPDGMLYIPLGDGGSGGDPHRNGNDPETLLGSLLRIDPTPSDGQPYTVPPDNPFAAGTFGDGIVGAPEVWAWGLRNPWKIAFDPLTGQLWIPDVGQNEFEEINVVGPDGNTPAGRGANFGWSAFEGTERFNDDVTIAGPVTDPVLTYSHADGCSISGGVPYRGTAIPELEPAFVYSDFCAGTIWAFDPAGGRNLTLLEGFDSVASVRAGPDGELYVLERSGTVHRLVQG